jgi:hypothetical protein
VANKKAPVQVVEQKPEQPEKKIEIKKIKINTFLTGSFGAFAKGQELSIPGDLPADTAQQFIADGLAEIV